jgi:hypothetical protein
MADFEVSISKTLSVRGKEWQTLKCHSLPLTESVLLIDTSKSVIPYL